jgi:hypothetical protein
MPVAQMVHPTVFDTGTRRGRTSVRNGQDHPSAGPLALRPAVASPARPRSSPWRGLVVGSLGPLVRIVISALMLALGVFTWMVFREVGGTLMVVDLAVFAVVTLMVLRLVWKRPRVR